MHLLVIGGVAAGTKVAAKYKRLDRAAQVTVLSKSQDISYAGCGLPYYVGGMIESREELIVSTPAKYSALTGVEVLTGREVVSLDPQGRTAVARNLATGEEETYAYDACVIAVGASPSVPPVPGWTCPACSPSAPPTTPSISAPSWTAARPGGRWWWAAASSVSRWPRT